MPIEADIFPKLLVNHAPPRRLELCSEITTSSDPEFCPANLVPGPHWTPAATTDGFGATTWTPFDAGSALRYNVALIRLPAALLEGHLLTGVKWQESDARRRDLKARMDEICRLLSSTPEALQHKGTFKGVRGKTSLHTTRNPSDKRLVGLHVDQIDHEPIATVERAMNRFCVNLGPVRRWFVFLPVALESVVKACRLTERDVLRSGYFHRTVQKHAGLIVCRIPIEPGDAYIAPTQIMLHDGQSDSQDGERLYTVVGPFDRTAQAQSLSIV
jgi:hypothetical protein